MAAVLGGMTLLQIAQLIAALDAAGLSLLKIRDELRVHGTKDTDELPLEAIQSVRKALEQISISSTAPGAFMESRSEGTSA